MMNGWQIPFSTDTGACTNVVFSLKNFTNHTKMLLFSYVSARSVNRNRKDWLSLCHSPINLKGLINRHYEKIQFISSYCHIHLHGNICTEN